MHLKFTIQGLPLHADLFVSDDVDEFMLGYNWLSENDCHWHFDQGVLEIKGMFVKLKQRHARSFVRRVYVRETVDIPTNTQINVPVRLPVSSLRTPKCDWVVETREIRPGLLGARTLLPSSDQFAAVRFLNLSGNSVLLKAGTFIGNAEPGICLGPIENNDNTAVMLCDNPSDNSRQPVSSRRHDTNVTGPNRQAASGRRHQAKGV